METLCGTLLDVKQQPIKNRLLALDALGRVASRGNEAAVTSLLACVIKDNCHDVRRPAMALLAVLSGEADARVLDLALTHLRKQDLRGQPLFKPYGCPMALTTEAIRVAAAVAPRGQPEVWALLLRRVVDDSVLAVRLPSTQMPNAADTAASVRVCVCPAICRCTCVRSRQTSMWRGSVLTWRGMKGARGGRGGAGRDRRRRHARRRWRARYGAGLGAGATRRHASG